MHSLARLSFQTTSNLEDFSENLPTHTLCLLNALLGEPLPQSVQYFGSPQFPPTLQNVLVLCTLFTYSKHSLLSLQSVQQLCGVFSLTLFSSNLKENYLVHTCTCSMPSWQSSTEFSTTLSSVPSLHNFSSKVFSNLEAPLESVIILVCPPDTFSSELKRVQIRTPCIGS
jgi:hypothetical protein